MLKRVKRRPQAVHRLGRTYQQHGAATSPFRGAIEQMRRSKASGLDPKVEGGEFESFAASTPAPAAAEDGTHRVDRVHVDRRHSPCEIL